MLKDYDTYELVMELSTREGVEKIDVGVEGNIDIEINDDGIKLDTFDEGPMVILKIID